MKRYLITWNGNVHTLTVNSKLINYSWTTENKVVDRDEGIVVISNSDSFPSELLARTRIQMREIRTIQAQPHPELN